MGQYRAALGWPRLGCMESHGADSHSGPQHNPDDNQSSIYTHTRTYMYMYMYHKQIAQCSTVVAQTSPHGRVIRDLIVIIRTFFYIINLTCPPPHPMPLPDACIHV